MTQMNGPLRVGIGGPVGAGKTTLTAALCARAARQPIRSASSPMTSTRKKTPRR